MFFFRRELQLIDKNAVNGGKLQFHHDSEKKQNGHLKFKKQNQTANLEYTEAILSVNCINPCQGRPKSVFCHHPGRPTAHLRPTGKVTVTDKTKSEQDVFVKHECPCINPCQGRPKSVFCYHPGRPTAHLRPTGKVTVTDKTR